MNLDRSLLTASEENESVPGELRSCINQHGRYKTRQFVLELSPRIHSILADIPAGIQRNLSFEQIQAYSTFLHETIHWWQHIGSTSGLLLSLSHPVQSHANFMHLKAVLQQVGPKKPLIKIASDERQTSLYSQAALREVNTTVNNFKDISFYQIFVTRPDLIRTRKIADDPFFDSVGHSYFVTYGNSLRMLTAHFDPKFEFLPNPRTWELEFQKLRKNKQVGYYYGSPIELPPVGLWEIFEGQARIIQLQYLYFGSGGRFGWDDAREMGMLGPVYIKAFQIFLKLMGSDWPDQINSPLVGLFLAVCDMAINPGEGFPFPIKFPQNFISENDPGTRFTFLSAMIAREAPYLKRLVKVYSKEEYLEITGKVCELMRTPSPISISQSMVHWADNHEPLIALMKEEEAFAFSPMDMPGRLLLSRFIVFNRDKAERPEFMCWPGAWMAGDRADNHGENIINRNMALFMDKEEDGGVFPAIPLNKEAKAVHATFEQFYTWIVNYEITSQWIAGNGPFQYNLEWLSTSHHPAEIEEWAKNNFQQVFDVHPDKFEIL